jgi:hypothetical protein
MFFKPGLNIESSKTIFPEKSIILTFLGCRLGSSIEI